MRNEMADEVYWLEEEESPTVTPSDVGSEEGNKGRSKIPIDGPEGPS